MALLFAIVSDDEKKTEYALFISKLLAFKSQCRRKEFHPIWLREEDVLALLEKRPEEFRNHGVEVLTAGQMLLAEIEADDQVVSKMHEVLSAVKDVFVPSLDREEIVRWTRTLDPIIPR